MTELRTYDFGVQNSVAVLSGSPKLWSYSSLSAIEMCPRRYVLTRAAYPELWAGQGYPEVPNPASLFGQVVHDSLEKIVYALVSGGCSSANGPQAVAVFREIGGFSEVVKQMLANRLAELDGNPRFDGPRRERLKDLLEHRIPEAREEIQRYLRRMTLVPRVKGDAGGGIGRNRHARSIGSYSEVILQSDDLRVFGRVDLLSVTPETADITDYKTGAEDESHLEQLRFYAMLWDQDKVSNAYRTPLGKLTASYRDREITIGAPEKAELGVMVDAVGRRVSEADDLATDPKTCGQTRCPLWLLSSSPIVWCLLANNSRPSNTRRRIVVRL